MWSGSEPASGRSSSYPSLRRGQVWLAEVPQLGPRRLVVLLMHDGVDAADTALLAAPLVTRATGARGVVAIREGDRLGGGSVDLRRITPLEPAALVQRVADVPEADLTEIDSALRTLLGITSAAPAAAHVAARAEGATPAEPRVSPAAPPPPPPPTEYPPLLGGGVPPGEATSTPDSAASGQLLDWSRTDASTGLDDHPMAQLFGRPRPVVHAPDVAAQRADTAAAGVPVATVLPELLELVRRRLYRSAPRLEAVLEQAAAEDRTVEWAAAAVRDSAVRGVMQSTLDEIASEIEAVASRRQPHLHDRA